MRTSCTLLGNASRRSANPRKRPWISDHSMELVRQKRTAVRVWTDLRRKWRWSALQRIFAVWGLRSVAGSLSSSCRCTRHGCVPCYIIANEKEVRDWVMSCKQSWLMTRSNTFTPWTRPPLWSGRLATTRPSGRLPALTASVRSGTSSPFSSAIIRAPAGPWARRARTPCHTPLR